MDYTFPHQNFPRFYQDGPPNLDLKHDYGGWGSYQQLLEITNESAQGDAERQTPFKFQSQHKAEGEVWIPTEPIATPFLPPNKGTRVFSGAFVSPDDFPDQMQYFHVHHCMDSFSTMGELLGEHFSFGKTTKKNIVRMGKLNDFLNNLNYKKCEHGHYSKRASRYHHLLSDVLPDIPSSLLTNLLYEELDYQRNLQHFQPAAAGGVLGYFPMQNQRELCLVYPSAEALDVINFHSVELEINDCMRPTLKTVKKPLVWNLNGTIKQVSVARVDEEAYVGLRSDYYCASWAMTDGNHPQPLEVVQLKECSTCINVSPHLSGEYAVASESGAAYLWTVGKGLQKIRDDKSNLYFNARSLWRWCDFTAHPRVMVYADQTGAELTDMRNSDSCHTLFRIGNVATCRKGERVILSKYIAESHAYHHLITTQYSTYIMDERMPSVPALKWEHMMESPPCFAQVVPPLAQGSTSKILLGASTAQDIVMLQYSGGRLLPCQAHGPVQKLCSPSESLKILQLPHRQHKTKKRLGVPAAGLAAVQSDGFLCLLQFTEMGDLFYQVLRHFDSSNSHSDQAFSVSSAPQQSVPMGEPCDFDMEQHRLQEAVVEHTCTSESEERISSEHNIVPGSSMHSVSINCAHPLRPANPQIASKQLKGIWKKWLETLLDTMKTKRHLRHRQLKVSHVMRFKSSRKDKLEKDKFLHLRKDLRTTLKTGKLLVHGTTYLPPLEVMPLPDVVNPASRPDDLSQRLCALWGDGWRQWWDEKLGMNKDYKIEALRRRRCREKRAKARNRVALSESFNSSMSYQDNLSEWSSAASQYLGSDSESVVNSESVAENKVLSEPSMLAESPILHGDMDTKCPSEETKTIEPVLKSPTQRPVQDRVPSSPKVHLLERSFFAETDSSMADVSNPTSQLKPVWRLRQQQQQRDYLSSLFGSQELSQDIEQDGDSTAPISQLSSFSFVTQTPSRFRAISQASQPQKKKSRMGF